MGSPTYVSFQPNTKHDSWDIVDNVYMYAINIHVYMYFEWYLMITYIIIMHYVLYIYL